MSMDGLIDGYLIWPIFYAHIPIFIYDWTTHSRAMDIDIQLGYIGYVFLTAGIDSLRITHNSIREVQHWSLVRPGSQSASQFAQRLLSGVEFRALCRQVKFLQTSDRKPLLYECGLVHSRYWYCMLKEENDKKNYHIFRNTLSKIYVLVLSGV